MKVKNYLCDLCSRAIPKELRIFGKIFSLRALRLCAMRRPGGFGCGFAVLRLLLLFPGNQLKCLSMNHLRSKLCVHNQAQSSLIKPDQGIFHVLRASAGKPSFRRLGLSLSPRPSPSNGLFNQI